ncbi:DUF192 domain-containing protein [Loktanella sp. SALINAS62]|uniref:DUF192 domain-containing protein n=1 Tax=Loktanella sp. SALINAS62 TaxID=2706124 RepID=UPI001B8AE6FC|nr:DUF192 domain-containing protein [Loktanella sp. SALINAS62]MBS1301678.1 DUF192 domain-containing protein [Loktanella sp. SALINAS62]
MKRLTILAVAVTAMLATDVQAAGCDPDVVTVLGDFGRARFAVDVADDDTERAQGLMNVPDMPTMTGMIFIYDEPRVASFWMRNTLIPLDMLFAGADGTIARIHPQAVPLDETPIFGGDDIQYVLEINGGLAARLGIAPGDVLQHPAIGPEAAAPCES